MDEKKIQAAMKIILDAGDARNANTKAINCILNDEYEQAEKYLAQANEKIVSAHQIQTNEIQDEAAQEKPSEYSLLFAHAQDTLMTIYSELHQTKTLIKFYKKLNEKIERLEKEYGRS